MKFALENIKFKDEISRIRFLILGLASFSIFALIIELIVDFSFFKLVIEIPLLATLLVLLIRTFNQFYYSLWTLASFLLIYLLYSFFHSLITLDAVLVGYFYGASIILLGTVMYLMMSPIFYPLVSWWEYDFRYRKDLPITLKFNDSDYEARIIDLRRNSAGIITFEKVPVSSEVVVSFTSGDRTIELKGIVYSYRKTYVGRPGLVGIQFHIKSEMVIYHELKKIWNDRQKEIKALRFENSQ
ncbi:MAG: PilZ domain-containing protein [Bacteriovoracaceae bacterium]